MSDVKDVVYTLLGIRKARDSAILHLVYVGMCASREHLVRVALVRDIEDDLVARRIKDRVECNGRFDDAEIRPDMSAVYARALNQCRAHLRCECTALRGRI